MLCLFFEGLHVYLHLKLYTFVNGGKLIDTSMRRVERPRYALNYASVRYVTRIVLSPVSYVSLIFEKIYHGSSPTPEVRRRFVLFYVALKVIKQIIVTDTELPQMENCGVTNRICGTMFTLLSGPRKSVASRKRMLNNLP